MTNFLQKARHSTRIFFTGIAMGIADLIPGVSGGTIAFISGIYEELIRSIQTVTGPVVVLVFKGKPVDALRLIPLWFLLPLALGIGSAILTLSHALAWLLDHQPVLLWSFFFGLVVASIVVVMRRIRKWSALTVLSALCSTAIAFVSVGLVPMETPDSLPWIFGSGVIAIIAMILPGISGSFILVILGKYAQILDAVNNRDIAVLGIFSIGCVTGLTLFSRVLNWLFARHHDLTVAILAGFMAGSLRKVWPWKEALITRVNRHGEIVPVVEKNLLPAWGSELGMAIGLCCAAMVLIALLEHFQHKRTAAP